MELATNDISAYKNISGSDEIQLEAGKTFKIETSPNGEDIVSVTVPEGKVHNIKVHLTIIETNA